ncbi:Phosphoinositide polyphosphatase (Sac family) [Ceratocystis platani]|uniref:Phosphoinositide polyphosphatase (Sac family) n=1 Tax=Ceratocystis fimbriata f. sp. platani TaxID=88771 RepID=A0A0F8BUV6_CERFI|nr:Phosphoinositide polyphosphatase (Sac family) [Ceratocystis platani]
MDNRATAASVPSPSSAPSRTAPATAANTPETPNAVMSTARNRAATTPDRTHTHNRVFSLRDSANEGTRPHIRSSHDHDADPSADRTSDDTRSLRFSSLPEELAPDARAQDQRIYTPTPGGSGINPDTSAADSGVANASTAANSAASQSAAAERKQRACDPCRGLKVKCEWTSDEAGVGSAFNNPCHRCSKSRRNCVVSVRARTNERHKRTDTRVSELEKRIDELTASLQAKSPGSSSTPASSKATAAAETIAGFKALIDGRNVAGVQTAAAQAEAAMSPDVMQDPWAIDIEQTTSGAAERPSKRRRRGEENGDSEADREHDGPCPTNGKPANKSATPEPQRGSPPGRAHRELIECDLIDRGLITVEESEHLFARYNDVMVQHMPSVVFPPNMRAVDLRRSKPLLFLAIMAVAASDTEPLQRRLMAETMQAISERAIVEGKKCLELVQALHISVIWYWPPEHFEELKFYQLVNLSVSIAIDIGLGTQPRRCISQKHAAMCHGWRGHKPPFGLTGAVPEVDVHFTSGTMYSHRGGQSCLNYNPPTGAGAAKTSPAAALCPSRRVQDVSDNLPSRRTWLTCYYLSCSTAISLRRPRMLRWSPFMAESVAILETSSEAAPTDRILCKYVRMLHISEDISNQFLPEESFCYLGLGDVRAQVSLRGFQESLEIIRNEICRERMPPATSMGLELTIMFLYEVVLQGDDQVNEEIESAMSNANACIHSSQTIAASTSNPLTASHIACISALLRSVTSLFDVFLSIDINKVRCLPVYNFVRVSYAMVILVKIHMLSSIPGSEASRLFPREAVKMEFYADQLVEKFRAAVQGNRSRPAAKFLVVLSLLRRWAVSEEANGAPGASAGMTGAAPSAAAAAPQGPDQTPKQSQHRRNERSQSSPQDNRGEDSQSHQQPQGPQKPGTPNESAASPLSSMYARGPADYNDTVARTPLHVLSAVATENCRPATSASPHTQYEDSAPASTSAWPQPGGLSQQQQQQAERQEQQRQQAAQQVQARAQAHAHAHAHQRNQQEHQYMSYPAPSMTPSYNANSTPPINEQIVPISAPLPQPMLVPNGMTGSENSQMFPTSSTSNADAAWNNPELVMGMTGTGGNEFNMNPNIDFERLMINFGMGLPPQYMDGYKMNMDTWNMTMDENGPGTGPGDGGSGAAGMYPRM